MTNHRFLTRRVPHVEWELLTLPSLLSSPPPPPLFNGVRVARPLVFCVMFCRSLFVLFFIFLATTVLSVLRFTASDYPFGIFKLFILSFFENRIFVHFKISNKSTMRRRKFLELDNNIYDMEQLDSNWTLTNILEDSQIYNCLWT
jgi:hypothetical protein